MNWSKNVHWEGPTSFECVLIGENQASKRKTGDSHSRMRTEEKLESAMVEQRVLEIQGCGFQSSLPCDLNSGHFDSDHFDSKLHIFAPVK